MLKEALLMNGIGAFPDGGGPDKLSKGEAMRCFLCENGVGHTDDKHPFTGSAIKGEGAGEKGFAPLHMPGGDGEDKIFLADEVIIEGGFRIFDALGEFIEVESEVTMLEEQLVRMLNHESFTLKPFTSFPIGNGHNDDKLAENDSESKKYIIGELCAERVTVALGSRGGEPCGGWMQLDLLHRRKRFENRFRLGGALLVVCGGFEPDFSYAAIRKGEPRHSKDDI